MESVAVSGINGYIGSHIAHEFLSHHYHVIGIGRGVGTPGKFDHVEQLDSSEGRVTLRECNINELDSVDEAIHGADYVIHAGAPSILYSKNPLSEIYRPTIDGCRHFLQAAKQTKSVKAFVLASSAAAITNRGQAGKTFTEADWNDSSSIEVDPYFKAKADAEKLAFRFVEKEAPDFRFASLLPPTVIGPSLSASLNVSPELIRDLITGEYPFIPDLYGGIVDVRDVAKCHRLIIENSQTEGRYICSAANWSVGEIVAYLRSRDLPGAKLPVFRIKSRLGNAMLRLLSYLSSDWRARYLRQHAGYPAEFSNRRIVEAVGIEFRSVEQSIDDTIADLQKWGHIALGPEA